MNTPKDLFTSFPQLVWSGLLWGYVANLVEILVTGRSTSFDYPVSPVEIGGAIAWILSYIQLTQSPSENSQPNIPSEVETPTQIFSISPETNLWNQLALRMITPEQFDIQMLALKKSY